MAIPQVDEQQYPTPDEVTSQLLSDIRYGYNRTGITVNVSEGSELFIRMKAIGTRISIAIQNNRLSLTDISPLDATGTALEELAAVFGVVKRPASSASGNVKVSVIGGGSVGIPLGFTISSPGGIVYSTTQSNTVVDGEFVEVQAETGGADTEVAPAVVMTWDSATIGTLGQNATVGPGGIDGGADADDDAKLRERLLTRLGFPEVGGNNAQVASFAEDSTAAVEKAFIYAAIRGPSSYDVAVSGEGGDRTLSLANIGIVAANILGNMPGSADLNTTSVTAQPVDIILNATLPLPVNAGGAGGGWRDAKPWPSTNEPGPVVFAEVTDTTFLLTESKITVNSTFPDTPKAGQRFGIWNPTGGSSGDGEMSEFAILAVGGASTAYEITIDTTQSDAISFIEEGMYCSAGSINLKTYCTDLLAAVQLLGPGEKTSNPDLLPRAARAPGPDVSYPATLTSITLSIVTNNHDELLNLEYAGRFDSGTKDVVITPSLPLTTADPPKILVLRNLSIRAQL